MKAILLWNSGLWTAREVGAMPPRYIVSNPFAKEDKHFYVVGHGTTPHTGDGLPDTIFYRQVEGEE